MAAFERAGQQGRNDLRIERFCKAAKGVLRCAGFVLDRDLRRWARWPSRHSIAGGGDARLGRVDQLLESFRPVYEPLTEGLRAELGEAGRLVDLE